MILVVGEALVDLVAAADGRFDPALGGAPANVAVAAARLGASVGFAGAISTDRLGDRLHARLTDAGVDTSAVVRTESPTSLAMVALDDRGAASYRFYFDGTSAPSLDHVDLTGVDALVTGGLALVLEPMASAVEDAIGRAADAEVPVVVDVNARPAVIGDLERVRHRVLDLLGSAQVVKVSDEDLALLMPDRSDVEAAASIVDSGAGAVVVTRGAAATDVVLATEATTVPVDPLPDAAAVVDTIGAGDTFVAGLVVSLAEAGCLAPGRASASLEQLEAGVRLGHAAAAVTVTRRGADPPRRDELAG